MRRACDPAVDNSQSASNTKNTDSPEQGLDPLTAYATLAECYNAPRLRGPFNREARLAAGFEQAEIDAL